MADPVSIFTIQPRLTQIALAVKPQNFIADQVLPRVPVPGEKFVYTKMGTDQYFRIPDTKIGRTSDPNTVEFGGVDVTDKTEDHGLEDIVPNKDIELAAGTNYDPMSEAAESTALLVELAREKRASDLIFTLETYASSLRTTLSGATQWSHADSNPVNALLAAMDAMLVRPNMLVLGRAVWTALRQHAKVVQAVYKQGTTAGVVPLEGLRDVLEIERILVGEAFYTASKKGQTASYSRLWGKHASLLRIDPNVRSTRSVLPTFGMTAEFGARQTMTRQTSQGVKGSTAVRVVEQIKELVCFQEAGYFFKDAVA